MRFLPALVYKHIDARFAAKLWTGDSIRLGTFKAYREMENLRADRAEGVQTNHIDGVLAGNDPSQIEFLRALNKTGTIHIPEGSSSKMSDLTIELVAPNRYLFCCSIKPDRKLCRRHNLCLIEIDLVGFVRSIINAWGGLSPADIGFVEYRKVDGYLSSGQFHALNPFLKPKEFKWEDEFRIVFNGFNKGADFIHLRVPAAARFMRLIPVKR